MPLCWFTPWLPAVEAWELKANLSGSRILYLRLWVQDPLWLPTRSFLLVQPLEAALVARGMGSSVVAQGMGFLPPAPGTWIALLSPEIGAGH